MILNGDVSKLLKSKKNINIFICGIGGIGTSGLALLAKSCGYNVYGSNLEENDNTKNLRKAGVEVFIGHNKDNLKECDIFVYTSAVNINTNVESIEAKKRQVVMLNRGKMLSIIMNDYYNIVIAGSHGKTTTTGLIGHAVNGLSLKPNVLVGGVLNSCKSNCHINDGKIFIVESDESDGSFLEMPVNICVITNIDPEHMEFYKNNEVLENYFIDFGEKGLDKTGTVICLDSQMCNDIYNKLRIEKDNKNGKLISYSIKNNEADYYGYNLRYKKNGLMFDVKDNLNKKDIKNVFLSNMFGDCNVLNALTTFAVSYLLENRNQLDKDYKDVINSLSNFEGIQKRFTILGKINNSIVVDDYAHNPQKIGCAIGSAKHYIKTNNISGKIIAVFEPHRYTRVRDGISGFCEALSKVDYVIVLPIYASSEKPIEGITQEFIVKELLKKNVKVVSCSLNIDEIKNAIKDIVKDDKDLIIVMGAGKSSKIAKQIID